MIRFTALILLALTLAACGTVPLPFRGAPKVTSDNPLIDVPAAMGVEVLPVSGLDAALSARLTRDIADRLLDLEIPSEPVTRPGGLGFMLTGRASASVSVGGTEQFDVTWTVRARKGTQVGQFEQKVQIPQEGPVPTARATAEQVAVAMGLTDTPGVAPAQAGAYAAKPQLPSVSVKPVEGAPGDGREALKLAILQALTDAGFHRNDVDPDINVYASFVAKEHEPGTQDVTITWRAVLRDGRELGHLNLENVVPNGALNGSWGPTAFAIAAAAQANLAKLLTSPPPEKAATAPPPKP